MAESDRLSVLLVATSYPRSATDWQGLFIQRIVDALGADASLDVSLWAPPGPRPERVSWAGDDGDRQFLNALAEAGGIAHLLRTKAPVGAYRAAGLLRRLHRLYRRSEADILHINWLQNALPLLGMGRRAVIPVLGTDFALLRLPGMSAALRRVFASNDCVLAPNAPWMAEELERRFAGVVRVEPVNFGIDDLWYSLQREPVEESREWLCVSRLTEGKVGDLFDWGEEVFGASTQLTLIGPNQGALPIPAWVHYVGAATPAELSRQWFPGCTGLLSLSRHSEGRPQVMLEAMAAGLPIVASALPAHRATIVHGKTGFLVNSREEFVNTMRRLEDPGLCAELGTAARLEARQRYGTWADCAARYRHLYRALL